MDNYYESKKKQELIFTQKNLNPEAPLSLTTNVSSSTLPMRGRATGVISAVGTERTRSNSSSSPPDVLIESFRHCRKREIR